MFDITGFFVGLALFIVFVSAFMLYLKFKGTPKFEKLLASVSNKFKNLTDRD